tara:strand:+ start:49 stop:303 length:255 start_codon:yes stop_codon:yes gene_type:complete
MIELIKMVEDLKEIKVSLGENVDNKTMNIIDKKIASYQHEIDEFEKWADAEAEKDAYLRGTVVSESDDSLLQAHPGSFSGEKSE